MFPSLLELVHFPLYLPFCSLVLSPSEGLKLIGNTKCFHFYLLSLSVTLKQQV